MTTRFTRSTAGRLEALDVRTRWGGSVQNVRRSTFRYDGEGMLDSIYLNAENTSGTALKQHLTHTVGHSLSRVRYSIAGAETAFGRTYGHDILERLTSATRPYTGSGITNGTERRGFSYDALGRLSAYSDTRHWTEIQCDYDVEPVQCWNQLRNSTLRTGAYSYDKVGNRTDRGEVYEAGSNRLLQVNGFTLTYDDDGNLLSKTGNGVTQTYAWNALGQLTGVTTNGVTESYFYDGFGRRVRKSGTTGRVYLYDGDDLLMEVSSAGLRLLEYTYYPGIDNPHSVKRTSDGKVFYYAMERPNHVAGLITGTGKLAAAYEYDPWGKPISVRQDSIVQNLRYGAREYDSATGLYYNRSRFYDPDLGRFISEDPIGLLGGINPYAYVSGDPVNYTDPTGLCPGFGTSNCPLLLPGPGLPDWWNREQVPVGLNRDGDGMTGDQVWSAIFFEILAREIIEIHSEYVRGMARARQASLDNGCGQNATEALGAAAFDAFAAYFGAPLKAAEGNLKLADLHLRAVARHRANGPAVRANVRQAYRYVQRGTSEVRAGQAAGVIGGAGKMYQGASTIWALVFSGQLGETVYEGAKLIPFLGTGSEIGETILACTTGEGLWG